MKSTQQKKRGPAPGTGGRPKGTTGPAKVRISVRVIPEHREEVLAAIKKITSQ